jgi:hypothetical protein
MDGRLWLLKMNHYGYLKKTIFLLVPLELKVKAACAPENAVRNLLRALRSFSADILKEIDGSVEENG